MLAHVIVVILSSLVVAMEPDRPPKLTFDQHVDYAEYYGRLIHKNYSANALEVYLEMLDESGELPLKEPAIKSQLGVDFTNITSGGIVWLPMEKPELVEYIESYNKYLEIFKRGTETERYWRSLPQDARYLHERSMMRYTACRRVAKVMLVDAWRQRENQVTELANTWALLLKHSSQVQAGGTVMDVLCAQGVERMVYRSVLSALASGTLHEKSEARLVLSKLSPCLPPDPAIETCLQIEWAMALDMLQYLFPGGRPDHERWEAHAQKFGGLSWKNPKSIDPRAEARRLDEVFRKLILLSKEPYYSQTRTRERLALEERPDFADESVPDILYSSLTRLLILCEVSQTIRRGVMLALAIESHGEQKGQWPRDLSQLKLPDPDQHIDPFSGKPFVYRVTEDGPLLYSLGPDGEDNGGVNDVTWAGTANRGDFVFLPATLPYRFKYDPKVE